jgi:DNA-binding NtrC family response regulator
MTEPVLIVEDDKMQQRMLATLLRRKLNFESCVASNGHEALEMLKQEKGKYIKLIILDINMPIMGGMETLEILNQRYPSIPVIMLTGNQEVEDVVQAMKLGAIDFLAKPYDAERVAITAKNALKIGLLSKEVTRLKKEKSGAFTFQNLIGHDGGLSEIVNIGRKAAASDIPALITGETGVGKEVFAQAIHGESQRTGKAFVAVNCGAIPNQLVESTLFGHEKGAFTGATDKAIGKFREANGGTIFLDEVGDLPLDAQVKLLRVLQEKEVEPVGASKSTSVNIRVISATNRNLKEEVLAGRFREDLYFRLNVLEIDIPPLRERKQDIALLLHHFIERFAALETRPLCVVSDHAQDLLMKHDWPGNVRELENAINRAMVLDEDHILDIDDFSKVIESTPSLVNAFIAKNPMDYSIFNQAGEFKSMEAIELEIISMALLKFNHNVTKAAKAVGMAKSTFYRKMNNLS